MYAGKVVKGNRNALFLIQNGARLQFPDFFTFEKMGYNSSSVMKIKDDVLMSIPLGPMIAALPQPPHFGLMITCFMSNVEILIAWY